MPWLYSEDGALKSKLQGLTVEDVNGTTQVAVRFRLPETEVANVTYPMIVIDHAGVSTAHDREHRGYTQLPYAPERQAIWWDPSAVSVSLADSPYYAEFPIPVNLDYDITLYCRKALQGVPLIPMLAQTQYLPPRFGYIINPDDHTVRSMDLLAGPEPSTVKDRDDKRLFTWSYKVRVYSEVLPSQITEFTKVTQVKTKLHYYLDNYDILYDA